MVWSGVLWHTDSHNPNETISGWPLAGQIGRITSKTARGAPRTASHCARRGEGGDDGGGVRQRSRATAAHPIILS